MSNEELADKIVKLPVWVREHIADLKRLAEPNNYELIRLRQQVAENQKRCRLADDRQNAMLEIFQAAARGGHEAAKELVTRVLANWLMDANGKSISDY